jgi:hypothetical protein
MPMREFAELVTGTGDTFHPSRLSDIENDKTTPSLDEVARIAAVDPHNRGRDWLGWGGDDQEGKQGAKSTNGHTPRTGSPREIDVEKTYPAELQPRAAKKTKRRPPNDRTASAG